MRDQRRNKKFLKTLEGRYCERCNDSEPSHLIWHPHQKRIKSYMTRYGIKSKKFKEGELLIEKSYPLCRNCEGERLWSYWSGEDTGLPWPRKIQVL